MIVKENPPTNERPEAVTSFAKFQQELFQDAANEWDTSLSLEDRVFCLVSLWGEEPGFFEILKDKDPEAVEAARKELPVLEPPKQIELRREIKSFQTKLRQISQLVKSLREGLDSLEEKCDLAEINVIHEPDSPEEVARIFADVAIGSFEEGLPISLYKDVGLHETTPYECLSPWGGSFTGRVTPEEMAKLRAYETKQRASREANWHSLSGRGSPQGEVRVGLTPLKLSRFAKEQPTQKQPTEAELRALVEEGLEAQRKLKLITDAMQKPDKT